MSKFSILVLFSVLLTVINCACQFGYFSANTPCDTQATPIQFKMYTTTMIDPSQWHYYYIPLGGLESNIKLFFRVDGPLPDAYLTFQPSSSDHLPTDLVYSYRFSVKEGRVDLPPARKINGIDNFDRAIMILGLRNGGSSATKIDLLYFADRDVEDNSTSLRSLILGIIISVSVAAMLLLCIGGYVSFVLKRFARRNAIAAAAAQNGNRADIEAQGILQNNDPASDHLSKEDVEKYFPKKPFKDLENPFQQTGCSVCLEDFTPEISCHQLYCNHIFHEACVEKWLEKHHNCPGCRVPIGKKAISDFIKKQEEDKKIDVIKI